MAGAPFLCRSHRDLRCCSGNHLALRHAIQARYGLDHLPGRCRGRRPCPALEAVQEPRLQPAAGRREIELIQLNGGFRRRFDVLPSGPSRACTGTSAGNAEVPVLRLGPFCSHHNDQDWINASKSLLIVSACVVSIPCGKPAYVFSVPFCTSSTARGPELA